MSSPASWTPAPRAGLVPLHPYGFGTILGRSFAALRGNPKVLLGFAMVVQVLGGIAAAVVIGAAAFASFSRLDTVSTGSPDFGTILAGSTLITGIATLVVTIAFGGITAIVQGVVVAEVAHATVGEQASLGRLWQRVRPAFWRLVGWFALQLLAALAVLVLLALPFLALIGGGVAPWLPFLSLIVTLPGALVLYLWLSTKLYLVPSAIVLEGAGVVAAVRRSWTLTRGRFWATLGVLVLVSLIMGVAASVVSFPLSLAGGLILGVLFPYGETQGADYWIATIGIQLLTQALTLLLQAIGVVVQSTSAVLVYIDARMRREGLDLRLQAYVEQRAVGEAPADPWAYDPHAAPSPWRAPAWPVPTPQVPYGAPLSGTPDAAAPGPYPQGPQPLQPTPPPYIPPQGAPALPPIPPAFGPPPYGPPPYGPPLYGPPVPPSAPRQDGPAQP